MDEQRTVELTDPRALRAYAHPLRMKLVGLLRREGPLTATRAAELLGESTGSMSFHLRQLAKYGLVEEAGGGVGRQKPWRATAQFTSLPEVTTSPEQAEASSEAHAAIAQLYLQQTLEWIARRADEPEQWQRAAHFTDRMLYLTAAELAELGEQIEALVEPYQGRLQAREQRPDGARLVTMIRLAFPR